MITESEKQYVKSQERELESLYDRRLISLEQYQIALEKLYKPFKEKL